MNYLSGLWGGIQGEMFAGGIQSEIFAWFVGR